MAPLGFEAGGTVFFIRRREWVAEFIHLHEYSFAPGYRIHLGIRVLNDAFAALALNGPDSHPCTCPDSSNGSLYELDFAPRPYRPAARRERPEQVCSGRRFGLARAR